MVTALLTLVLGVLLLIAGGELLVLGASRLARGLGWSRLVVGLTVVAFGTSAPELAVNIISVVSGRGGLAFGNVVGSNLANVGLILGLSAMIRPLVVRRELVRREIPMMLFSTAVALLFAADRFLVGRTDRVDRGEGLVLLLLFGLFLYTSVFGSMREGEPDLLRGDNRFERLVRGRLPSWAAGSVLSAALLLLGLVALLWGGERTVESAAGLARGLGVSEAVIGLLVVAVGTSLPELATSLAALRRDEIDIAVGNVVGSNIFNLLLVLGASATVRGVDVPNMGLGDLFASLVLSGALLPLSFSGRRRILRLEGLLLFTFYVAYCAQRFVNAS